MGVGFLPYLVVFPFGRIWHKKVDFGTTFEKWSMWGIPGDFPIPVPNSTFSYQILPPNFSPNLLPNLDLSIYKVQACGPSDRATPLGIAAPGRAPFHHVCFMCVIYIALRLSDHSDRGYR